jgi:hypothetical protein
MNRLSWGLMGLLAHGWAQAHEGHGLPGQSHWHASDLLGFVLALLVVAGMAWWGGRGR